MPRYDKAEYQGDSRPYTQKHIDLVNENGKKFSDKFLERRTHHDIRKTKKDKKMDLDRALAFVCALICVVIVLWMLSSW